MESTLLGLAVAYVLPIVGLGLVATGRLRPPILASILLALPLFYLAHYLGLKALQGWPTAEALPERFEVLAERVVEPDARSGEPGAIYLWIQTAQDDRPRAFRLPYSRALHTEADQAGKRRAAGAVQRGVRVVRESDGSVTTGGRELPIRITDRVNPRPPPKTTGKAGKTGLEAGS
jgi:hypothetical protein